MSFGFSVGDFIGVLQLANKVRKEFVGAPNRFKDISDEVRSLSIVLHDVDICLSECEISDEQEVHLREISASCERLLRKLEATLDKYVELEGTDTGLRKRARRGWKRIQWEPEDIRDLRDRITANVILLNAFLDSISSRVTFTTKKGVDRLNQRQEDEERLCICDWLTPIEYAPQQQDFLNRRQPGTGQWLLDSKQYQLWLATPGQILFCPGIPGAGKTILTAIAIEDLTTRYRERPEIGIAYTYFNFRRRDEQKVGHLLASILKQLGRIQPSLPVPVRALWDNHKEKQTRPSVEEISHALHLVSSLYKSVFIVIDALDECQTSDGCRTQFITEVLKLQNGYNANVFVTSRFIPEIVDKFRNTNNTTNLEIQACRQDIEAYIEGNLVELPSFVQRNKNLQIDIKNAISEAVDGMFLLAQIYLRSLDDKPTTKAVRNALQQFQGQGRVSASEDSRAMVLSRAYDQAMERINGQMAGFRDLARRVLSWITCSKRPLTVMELRHALAVEIGERELDEENLPEAEDMVSVCAGLVTVDDESDTIRLVHYTAQEYLERTLELWYPKAETEITRVCVTYLSFETFESGFCRIADDFRKQLQSNPFYDYAIHYWGYHARKAPDALSETVAFLSCQPKVDPAGQGAMIVGGLWGYVWRVPGMTGLHLAAFFGLASAAKALLELGYEPDPKDSYGRTPLVWAAACGHDAVVEVLLSTNNINPNHKDNDGQTPLAVAAGNGNIQVTTLLLSKTDACPDLGDNDGITPLWLAIFYGSDAVVAALLGTGQVNTDSKQYRGQTPLSYAATTGRESLVELLLAAGVDPDRPDAWDWTPLVRAAKQGHDLIVERLLTTNKVDCNARDGHGRTPLICAALGGHRRITKLLLSAHSVLVNSKDSQGRMPICWAARNGHDEIVKMLLETGLADPNIEDNDGYTPLSLAAGNNHEAVVRVLLTDAAVDANRKDRYGLTPLWTAECMGYKAVAELLRLHTTSTVQWTEEILVVPAVS